METTRRTERTADSDAQTPSGPDHSIAAFATEDAPGIDSSPWPDHEFVRGYGVMVIPFSTGHQLALRVWRRSSFGPYASVWHRPPDGEWSIYSDGPSLETTCARYWGGAAEETALTDVEVTWTGPTDLRVEMAEPKLVWTLSMRASKTLRRANAVNASFPRWSWKPRALLAAREWWARRALDLGPVRFSFTTASGHETVLVPERTYHVASATAVLAGESLGEPVTLDHTPTIGDVPLPKRPIFVVGEAHMRITDPAEYRETRAAVRRDLSGSAGTGSREIDSRETGSRGTD